MRQTAASRLYDSTTSVLAFLTRYRRVKPTRRPVLVNIGSGLVTAPGWINVDVGLPALVAGTPRFIRRFVFKLLPSSSAAKQLGEDAFCSALDGQSFVHHRVEYGLPFADDSVDAIYSSHFHEHLYRSDGQRLLREAFRVLRPGGVIRVCVPDLDYVLSLFQTDTEAALAFFFYDRGPSAYTRHRYMYDFTILEQDFRSAGFRQIERLAYRQGRVPDLDVLDNRESETLYAEAIKP